MWQFRASEARCMTVYGYLQARNQGHHAIDRLEETGSARRPSLKGRERAKTVLKLQNYLREQSQGHHAIDRQEERGVERGSARRPSLKGRERAIVSQTNTGAVSKATLGKLLRDGVERIWAFPSA